MSAQTARLAVTPAPAGRPGGPGLWRVKGMALPPYFENIRNALIRSGHSQKAAYQITWGAIRRWARGGGKVHPEVVAAAQAALADLAAKAARAHSDHSHANDGDAVTTVDLAGVFNSALHPRGAAGTSSGGQFVSGSSGSTTKTSTSTIHSKQTGRYYTQSQWSALHQEHMDHLQHLVDTGKATPAQKAELAALKKQKAAAVKAKTKTTSAKKTTAKKKAVAKPKKVAAPKVNKAKGTVTATINGKKVTMTLHQWHVLHVAHEKAAATKLAGDSPAVELAVKTPAPERAAGRQALAAKGQALADGSFPVPTVEYLKKAIRSVGRAPASKRPALKALIRKRARELGATNEPGVKGTWAFQGASDHDAVELAMMTKTARVRGPGDVTCSRTASGEVTVTHKPTGMRIGKLTPAQHGGWQGTHATGKATPASGSMAGALSGLIGVHNKIAASMPDAMPMPEVQAHAQQLAAMELAGSFTPAVTSGDGPRVTTMGGAGKTATTVSAPASGAPSAATIASWPAEVQLVYKKLLAKGFSPKQALAFAKRASAMHAKAQAPKASAASRAA